MANDIRLMGHRGLRDDEQIPENSIPAFTSTYAKGVRGHETDLQVVYDKDGKPVIVLFHDSEDDEGLMRSTDVQKWIDQGPGYDTDLEFSAKLKKLADNDPRGQGRVYLSDLTYEESQKLNLTTPNKNDPDNPHVTEFKIPTLTRTLEDITAIRTGADDGYQLNLELKKQNVFVRDADDVPETVDLGDPEEVIENTMVLKNKDGDLTRYKIQTRPIMEALSEQLEALDQQEEWSLVENIIVSSFDKPMLKEMQRINDNIPRRALFSEPINKRKWVTSEDGMSKQWIVDGNVKAERPIEPNDTWHKIIDEDQSVWDLTDEQVIDEMRHTIAEGIAPSSFALSMGQITPAVVEFFESLRPANGNGFLEYDHPDGGKRRAKLCFWTTNEVPVSKERLHEVFALIQRMESLGIVDTMITDFPVEMTNAWTQFKARKTVPNMHATVSRELKDGTAPIPLKNRREAEVDVAPSNANADIRLYQQIYNLSVRGTDNNEAIKKLLSNKKVNEIAISKIAETQPEVADAVLSQFARVEAENFKALVSNIRQDRLADSKMLFGNKEAMPIQKPGSPLTHTGSAGAGWLGEALIGEDNEGKKGIHKIAKPAPGAREALETEKRNFDIVQNKLDENGQVVIKDGEPVNEYHKHILQSTGRTTLNKADGTPYDDVRKELDDNGVEIQSAIEVRVPPEFDILLEYIGGEDFKEVEAELDKMVADGIISEAERDGAIMQKVAEAATGIAYLAEKGYEFRDLHKGNLRIEAKSGRLVIIDYGLGDKVNESPKVVWAATERDGDINPLRKAYETDAHQLMQAVVLPLVGVPKYPLDEKIPAGKQSATAQHFADYLKEFHLQIELIAAREISKASCHRADIMRREPPSLENREHEFRGDFTDMVIKDYEWGEALTEESDRLLQATARGNSGSRTAKPSGAIGKYGDADRANERDFRPEDIAFRRQQLDDKYDRLINASKQRQKNLLDNPSPEVRNTALVNLLRSTGIGKGISENYDINSLIDPTVSSDRANEIMQMAIVRGIPSKQQDPAKYQSKLKQYELSEEKVESLKEKMIRVAPAPKSLNRPAEPIDVKAYTDQVEAVLNNPQVRELSTAATKAIAENRIPANVKDYSTTADLPATSLQAVEGLALNVSHDEKREDLTLSMQNMVSVRALQDKLRTAEATRAVTQFDQLSQQFAAPPITTTAENERDELMNLANQISGAKSIDDTYHQKAVVQKTPEFVKEEVIDKLNIKLSKALASLERQRNEKNVLRIDQVKTDLNSWNDDLLQRFTGDAQKALDKGNEFKRKATDPALVHEEAALSASPAKENKQPTIYSKATSTLSAVAVEVASNLSAAASEVVSAISAVAPSSVKETSASLAGKIASSAASTSIKNIAGKIFGPSVSLLPIAPQVKDQPLPSANLEGFSVVSPYVQIALKVKHQDPNNHEIDGHPTLQTIAEIHPKEVSTLNNKEMGFSNLCISDFRPLKKKESDRNLRIEELDDFANEALASVKLSDLRKVGPMAEDKSLNLDELEIMTDEMTQMLTAAKITLDEGVRDVEQERRNYMQLDAQQKRLERETSNIKKIFALKEKVHAQNLEYGRDLSAKEKWDKKVSNGVILDPTVKEAINKLRWEVVTEKKDNFKVNNITVGGKIHPTAVALHTASKDHVVLLHVESGIDVYTVLTQRQAAKSGLNSEFQRQMKAHESTGKIPPPATRNKPLSIVADSEVLDKVANRSATNRATRH